MHHPPKHDISIENVLDRLVHLVYQVLRPLHYAMTRNEKAELSIDNSSTIFLMNIVSEEGSLAARNLPPRSLPPHFIDGKLLPQR